MNYFNEGLEDYIIKHSQQEPRILKDLNRETNLKVLQPRMISGAHQGRLLSMISKINTPEKYSRNWNLYRVRSPVSCRRYASKWNA